MKQRYVDIIVITILILIFGGIFLLFFSVIKATESEASYHDYCSYKYGEDWFYEDNNVFGKLCVQVEISSLEILNRTILDLDYYEVQMFCERPGTFELTKWTNKCSLFAKEKK